MQTRTDNQSSGLLHFVLTRFNIRTELWVGRTDKNSGAVLTEEWLEQRVALFKQYCLPSMVQQSTERFHWLIYLDVDSPPALREYFTTLEQQYPFIYPQYVPNHREMLKEVRLYSYIQMRRHNCSFLITTRLDNDDALSRDALARIQRAAQEVRAAVPQSKRVAINLRHGLNLLVEPTFVLHRHQDSANAFISLVEDCSEADAVYTVFYTDPTSYLNNAELPLVQVEDGRYWLQIVHKRNLSNLLRTIPSFNVDELANFGIDPSTIHLNRVDTLRYTLADGLRRLVRKVQYQARRLNATR